MSFSLTQPKLLRKAPMDWPDIHGVTLDTFYLFDKNLQVERCLSGMKCYDLMSIENACRKLRKKPKGTEDSCVFTVNISMHDRLDEEFKVPEIVKESSLFPMYYPNYKLSKYLRKNYKFFQAFRENYKSPPNISYGGLVEWLYVTSGILYVTLYKRTRRNLVLYHSLEENEDLNPEENTVSSHELKAGSLFSIPAGWISVKETRNKAACVYGGRVLSLDDTANQLDAFEDDVINSNCQYVLDRDAEIRSLYWFFTIYLVKGASRHGTLTIDQVVSLLECLRKHLVEWNKKYRKCKSDQQACLPAEVFAPEGIHINTLLKDLGSLVRRRKPLQGEKDTLDVNMSQTSAEENLD